MEFVNDREDCALGDVMVGADVFLGLSKGGVVNGDMVASMAEKALIFALANPDPEILPEDVRAVRDDAIIATGRSDYPNKSTMFSDFPTYSEVHSMSERLVSQRK